MGPEPKPFTMGFYYSAVNGLLRRPRAFFGMLSPHMGILPPLAVLWLSGLIFSAARLILAMPSRPLLWGGIWLVNSVGMALIAAGIGYMAMVMMIGRKVAFRRFLGVYALSNGITLLISWLPFLFWITEPWKWWLIGTGLTSGLGLRPAQAGWIIGITIVVMVLFFGSLLPLIS